MAFKTVLLVAYVALCLLSVYHADAFSIRNWFKKEPKRVGMSWNNCGPGTDPEQVKSLTITPDPIKVPGNVTAGASISLTAASPTDIGISVTMEKKVAGFWVKVPCVDKVGSCTYGDLCKDWADVCPKVFPNGTLPCTCPIPVGTYTIPNSVFDITGKLPPGAAGDFRVTGNLVSPTAGHLGCLHVEVNIAS